MADFPRFEWMEIDGRMVPSVKPQHYKKGSTTATELTGHDNPLPVANYTQNEKGVWLPTSKDNPVPTQVTGSIVGERLGYEVIPDGGFIEAYIDLKHSYFRLLVAPDEATRIQLFHAWLDANGSSLSGLRSVTTTDVDVVYITEKSESQTAGYRVRLYNRGDVPVRMKLEFIHLER